MPRPRNNSEMRPSMPARKRWPSLNSELISSASRSGRLGAATLWDAHHLDSVLYARRHVFLAEEAPIRSIAFGGMTEGLPFGVAAKEQRAARRRDFRRALRTG
jgi:hypothetical protein